MTGPYRGQPSRTGQPLRCGACGGLATHRAIWRSNGTSRGSALFCAGCVAEVRNLPVGRLRPDVVVELAAWHRHIAESLRERRLARETGR